MPEVKSLGVILDLELSIRNTSITLLLQLSFIYKNNTFTLPDVQTDWSFAVPQCSFFGLETPCCIQHSSQSIDRITILHNSAVLALHWSPVTVRTDLFQILLFLLPVYFYILLQAVYFELWIYTYRANGYCYIQTWWIFNLLFSLYYIVLQPLVFFLSVILCFYLSYRAFCSWQNTLGPS